MLRIVGRKTEDGDCYVVRFDDSFVSQLEAVFQAGRWALDEELGFNEIDCCEMCGRICELVESLECD